MAISVCSYLVGLATHDWSRPGPGPVSATTRTITRSRLRWRIPILQWQKCFVRLECMMHLNEKRTVYSRQARFTTGSVLPDGRAGISILEVVMSLILAWPSPQQATSETISTLNRKKLLPGRFGITPYTPSAKTVPQKPKLDSVSDQHFTLAVLWFQPGVRFPHLGGLPHSTWATVHRRGAAFSCHTKQ